MSGMPTWEEFNVPVLTVLSDGATRTLRELRRDVADAVGLTARGSRDRSGHPMRSFRAKDIA